MSEWVDTVFTDTAANKFYDTNQNRWHKWSSKSPQNRRRKRVVTDYVNKKEWGRKPYMDGSNWGIISQPRKLRNPLKRERGLVQERTKKRGQKI